MSNRVFRNVAQNSGSGNALSTTSEQVSAGGTTSSGIRIFQNDSATATELIYLRLGTAAAVVGQGIRLNAAGGSVVIDGYTGPIQAVAAVGTPNLLITEV